MGLLPILRGLLPPCFHLLVLTAALVLLTEASRRPGGPQEEGVLA